MSGEGSWISTAATLTGIVDEVTTEVDRHGESAGRDFCTKMRMKNVCPAGEIFGEKKHYWKKKN